MKATVKKTRIKYQKVNQLLNEIELLDYEVTSDRKLLTQKVKDVKSTPGYITDSGEIHQSLTTFTFPASDLVLGINMGIIGLEPAAGTTEIKLSSKLWMEYSETCCGFNAYRQTSLRGPEQMYIEHIYIHGSEWKGVQATVETIVAKF